MALVVVAIGLLSIALAQTLRNRHQNRAPVPWAVFNWTPPYAPEFRPTNAQVVASGDFTVEGINTRRARSEAIRAADNTEFIYESMAYRCRACRAMYTDWLSAFECHKRA